MIKVSDFKSKNSGLEIKIEKQGDYWESIRIADLYREFNANPVYDKTYQHYALGSNSRELLDE